MDTAVNFYELKNQFADLGFNGPDMIDYLRIEMAGGADQFKLSYQERIGSNVLTCAFDLGRQGSGQPVTLNYYESALQQDGHEGISARTFAADVNKDNAVLTLDRALHTPGDADNDLPWTMNTQDVERSLERFIPRQLDHAKLDELQGQLNELGFQSPGSKDALSAILVYSRIEATLHTKQPAGEREAEFCLAYTEGIQGWKLYCIEGMMQKPGDTGIIPNSELKSVFMQNFQPGVTAAEAIAFLQNYTKLPREHDPFMPLSQNDVQTHLKNFKTMNEQNLDFLNNSMKYLGFEEKTAAVMDTKIRQGIPEFQVTAQHDHFNNSVFHTLHFKKSAETDMYFFNKYDAKLSNGKPEGDKTQTFYIKNGQGFTAKEAFNLLEGRAVYKELKNKEGQAYSAWSKLDLDKDKNNNYPVRQYTSGWGYDLEKSVSRFPVKELGDEEQKAALLKSLQKGNQQQVTIDKDGKPEKFYFEAAPNLRTINIYDTRRKEVKRDTLLKPELKVKKEKKEDQSQSEDQKQGKKRSRGRGI
jgi:hypothetical protein